MSREVFSTLGFGGLVKVPDFAAERRVGFGAEVLDALPLPALAAGDLPLPALTPAEGDLPLPAPTLAADDLPLLAPAPAEGDLPARDEGDFPAPDRLDADFPDFSISFFVGRGLFLIGADSDESSAFPLFTVPPFVRVSGISGTFLAESFTRRAAFSSNLRLSATPIWLLRNASERFF